MSTNTSAWVSCATMAERVSLSPNSISSTDTVSFSLTMGMVPNFISCSKVLTTRQRRSWESTTSRVISTWAMVWLYSENILSYKYISSHCPTAAVACLAAMSCGRSRICSLPMPTAMAPEETRMISLPAFWISESTFTSCSRRRMLIWPELWVRVELPTLMTTRVAF